MPVTVWPGTWGLRNTIEYKMVEWNMALNGPTPFRFTRFVCSERPLSYRCLGLMSLSTSTLIARMRLISVRLRPDSSDH